MLAAVAHGQPSLDTPPRAFASSISKLSCVPRRQLLVTVLLPESPLPPGCGRSQFLDRPPRSRGGEAHHQSPRTAVLGIASLPVQLAQLRTELQNSKVGS